MLPLPYWITVLATVIAVVACVVHYEGLRLLSDKLPKLPIHHHRRRIILLILCLMLLHIAEIWIFGLNYFWLQYMQGFGEFVGFGDIVAVGPIRFMTGVEAVTGLTFITWSASFTFLEMLKTWNHSD